MLPTDRISHSAITERPPLKLPDGARVAVWVRQRRGMGSARSNAAHRAHAAGGRLAHARHSELGLARIRQSRRLPLSSETKCNTPADLISAG